MGAIVFISFFLFIIPLLVLSYFSTKAVINKKIKKEALKLDMIVTKIQSTEKTLDIKEAYSKHSLSYYMKNYGLISYGLGINQGLTKEIIFHSRKEKSVKVNKKLVFIKIFLFYPYKIYFE